MHDSLRPFVISAVFEKNSTKTSWRTKSTARFSLCGPVTLYSIRPRCPSGIQSAGTPETQSNYYTIPKCQK